jgi:hypothetical protein
METTEKAAVTVAVVIVTAEMVMAVMAGTTMMAVAAVMAEMVIASAGITEKEAVATVIMAVAMVMTATVGMAEKAVADNREVGGRDTGL